MKKRHYILPWILLLCFACNQEIRVEKSLCVDFKYTPRYWQTCFGIKDDLYKSMLAYDGSLWYNFVHGAHLGVPYNNDCYGREKGYTLIFRPQLKKYEKFDIDTQEIYGPEIPVITNIKKKKDIEYKQTVWASFSNLESVPKSRFDCCRMEAQNHGTQSKKAGFRVEINSFYPLTLNENKTRVQMMQNDTVYTLCDFSKEVSFFGGESTNMKFLYYFDFPEVSLQPGATDKLTFVVYRDEIVDTKGVLTQPEPDIKSMISYWESLQLPYNKIVVPDKGIQNLLNSCVRNIYQAREIKNGIPAFQVGPTFYRGTWAVDGPFFMEAMTFLGEKDDVRKAIEGIFQHGESQGPVGEEFSKQAGLRIWMIFRHAVLTADMDWLNKMWPYLTQEVETIKRYRKNSYSDGSNFTSGLMPQGFPDGGLGGKHAEYTNTYWALAGLNTAVMAAEKLNKTTLAKSWEEEYEDFYHVFNKARNRDKKTDEFGNVYIPTIMDKNTLTSTSGQWAFMHSVYPGKIFDVHDPLMKGTLAMLDSNLREGIIYATGWLDQGLWSYTASFHGHAHLWLGNGSKVPKIMYDFANHASPLLCWSEEQDPIDDEGKYYLCGDMPHNWASIEFIRLIRHSLVLERGDELHLFEGMPDEWTKPSMKTALHGIYTDFGIISLELDINDDGKDAEFSIQFNDIAYPHPAKVILYTRAITGEDKMVNLPYKTSLKYNIHIK